MKIKEREQRNDSKRKSRECLMLAVGSLTGRVKVLTAKRKLSNHTWKFNSVFVTCVLFVRRGFVETDAYYFTCTIEGVVSRS